MVNAFKWKGAWHRVITWLFKRHQEKQKRQLSLDLVLFGSCFHEETWYGVKRVDPSKILIQKKQIGEQLSGINEKKWRTAIINRKGA